MIAKGPIMTPRQVVELWVDRFNAGDTAGLAELYQDDAINHQVTQEPVRGREAIRATFERDFKTAEMVCIPDTIHEAGEVGLRGCGFFTIHNGRIAFQRGYWDKLSFLKLHGLPLE
jgi:limonene-1,2-epoxide hydrolase